MDAAWSLPEPEQRIFNASDAWITERTVGVYRQMPGGNPVLEGSGVLLQIADVAFLVSARHVLEATTEAFIQIGPMTDQSRFVQLAPTAVRVSRDREIVDLGYAELSSENAGALASFGKRFLRLDELQLVEQPTPGFYSVFGYPKTPNTPNYDTKVINPKPFVYATSLCQGDVDGFVHGTSIAVEWTELEINLPGGGTGRMIPVGGISGCGMWLLYSRDGGRERLNRWTPSWIRLAGIEHSVVQRKWIKGTLIRRLVEMIAAGYPELRASIQLTLR